MKDISNHNLLLSFDMVGQVIFFPGSEFFINYLSLIADDEDSFPPKNITTFWAHMWPPQEYNILIDAQVQKVDN